MGNRNDQRLLSHLLTIRRLADPYDSCGRQDELKRNNAVIDLNRKSASVKSC